MDRRDFLTVTAAAIGLPDDELFGSTQGDAVDDYQLALSQSEKSVPASLALQATDRNHRQAGGFIIPAYGFAYPASTAGEITRLGTLFCNRDSRYYHDPALAVRMTLGMGYLEKEQHPDGTIDLPTTNFHSPPDTGFVIEDLTLLYRLLQKDGSDPARDLMARLEKFIRRAARAIATGGIHTPNHRWVASAALAASYRIFKDPLYLKRIDEWLAEGMDCNADGEYTELSNAVYNRVTNRAIMSIAESIDRPQLLDYVRRNISMMMICVHPDGEIVTDYSRRQDRNTRARMNGYYIPYRVLSVRDNNGQFASMADWIASQARTMPDQVSLGGDLPDLMLRPDLRHEKIERKPLPDNYSRIFSESGAARIRRESLSATVTSNSSRFFSMRSGQSGSAVLESVRVASAFFGKGQFVSEKLYSNQNEFRLVQSLEAGYIQPLPPGSGIPNPRWSELDHKLRERSHICRLQTTITIREIQKGFEISINSTGTDNVPIVVEFWFRSGGILSSRDGGEIISQNGSNFLTSGHAKYSAGSNSLIIGPCIANHRWASLRGAEAPIPDAVPLTMAGFTPFDHTFRIVAQ